MSKKRFEVWLPLLFSIVLIVGMYLGYRFSAGMPNASFLKPEQSTALQEVVTIIKKRYVDSIQTDTLEANAIKEIMNELDPHSVYLPPVALKEATEDLSGNFEGIGVEFNQIRDTVNITYVIKDGPSDKAGLQIGDQLIKANEVSLVEKNMPTAKIRNLIRGPKGSKVVMTVVRNNKPMKVVVERGNIPTPSVAAAYMIDAHTGYLKLDKFTSVSYREFMEALEALKKKGMQQLLFDLRGNSGGFMEEAVEMADEFLSGDKLIVYTQGANSPKEEYRCKRPGQMESGKVAVLVDELSASASEVLSGALQDWDRATIVGRRTFGKGLVQQLYQLSDGSAIKLTVSRYYTPLGRSIQKPYGGGKNMYMEEVWNRFSNGEAYYADSNKITTGKRFTTPAGHLLYGGGGIMPDVFVGLDTSKSYRVINKLLYNGSFSDFVFHYFLDNKNILAPYTTPQSYTLSFDASKDMWMKLVDWMKKENIDVKNITPVERQKLEERAKAYLARFKWRDNGYYQVINSKDPVVLKAMEVLQAQQSK